MNTDNSPTPNEESDANLNPPASDNEAAVDSANVSEIRKFLVQDILSDSSRDERGDYQEYFVEDYSDISKASLSRLSKWESENGKPNKLYFSLSEAAHIAGLDSSALIHAGGNGSIALCTLLPLGLKVFPFYEGSVGQIVDQPELLVLNMDDCRRIELNGMVAQSDFESGYAFPFSEAICIFPGYRNYDFMYKEATWKVFGGAFPSCINVSSYQLFITRLGLYQFLDSQAGDGQLGNQLSNKKRLNTENEPYWTENDDDPDPKYRWYIPARYFARQLIATDSSLLMKRDLLAQKVAALLEEKKILKRGGIQPLDQSTVKNAFSKVNFKK